MALYIGGLLLTFMLGAAGGVLLQRNVGVGNVMRAVHLMPTLPATPGPTPTRPAVGIPADFQGRLTLFVLAGQSNMSGWSPLPAEQALHPRIFLFGNDYRWRLGSEPIDHPEGQVDLVSRDFGSDLGTSPGMAFAAALLEERPAIIVGLIPCAKGDSTLHEWRRNLGDNTLYGSCLKRIAAASTMGELAGILFFQGEADAVDPAQSNGRIVSAHDYSQRFSQLIHDLRDDLGQPHLPVVFAQIGSQLAPQAFINWAVVQEQQAAVRLPCTAMITTSDLPLRDGLHYTTESYQAIGRRFAEGYVQLTDTQECE